MLRGRTRDTEKFGKAGVGVWNLMKSESEILQRSELESDILTPTPQPWCGHEKVQKPKINSLNSQVNTEKQSSDRT